MEYMTTQDAAAQWGITQRQVQHLCARGMVSGAMRFSRSYIIPKGAPKPADARRKHAGEPGHVVPVSHSEEIPFREMFDRFPYRINVSTADGTMVYANRLFMEGTLPGVPEQALGTYNILTEPNLESWGLVEHVRRAFTGEVVSTFNVEFPNRMMVGTRYGKEYAFLSLYHDITSFPLHDAAGELRYIVAVFIPVRRLIERQEVLRGREYIETHWREPYSAAGVARAANISVSRFSHMFKEDVGFFPHEYYLEIKLKHIKEKLLDVNLSVSQAFDACGVDYNSYYTTLFKKHVGVTPSSYKKANGKRRQG